jgi:hypothetical protein
MKRKNDVIEEKIPKEKELRLAPEDADETTQQIEEAAYYIGLNRERHSFPGDNLTDWYDAEKAIKENLKEF